MLESKEGNNGSGQIIIFVVFKLADLLLIFSHLVEFETLDGCSTKSQEPDKIRIVKCKLDDSDFE